ncbi:MAG: EamA family transporter [Proteobacteria bacterium]|jgi:drug/metabolite transporter (DMT)-like permease|nr:EamA family transporter [Pseudomonadota bacterium]MDA0971968.1 EamA family transporter [Pseudomonadota bacterium]MDA0996512.1 EamA family transporter [Pseudomonadota bacterium]
MNWILISVIAAFFQNLRSGIQKNLNKNISLVASTYVRFMFSLPFAALIFFFYFNGFEQLTILLQQKTFLIYVISGSLAQIFFTFVLLYSFQFSNFIVGTTLSKTEVVQISILETLLFQDHFNNLTILGIVISTIGVIIFSTKDKQVLINNLISKSTVIGLFCGFLLALSVVCYRGATLHLEVLSNNFDKALSTLFLAVVFQSIIMTIYIFIFEKEQFKKMYEHKQQCLLAGLSGFLATISWFYAFTIMQAAIVRAVGQVELLFSYIASRYYFKEKIKIEEIIGILIFVLGVLIILTTKL